MVDNLLSLVKVDNVMGSKIPSTFRINRFTALEAECQNEIAFTGTRDDLPAGL
jgi:hypothetical protein